MIKDCAVKNIVKEDIYGRGIIEERYYRGGSNRLLQLVFVLGFFYFYFWLCWAFVAAHGFSLVAASGGYSWSWCLGFSLLWLLLLPSTGSRCEGSVVVHGLGNCATFGILPNQGLNLCLLH